jgi:hypothetical protein
VIVAGMDAHRLARAALLTPIPAIVLEPITATAYFRTADGRGSADPNWISAWSDPLARNFPAAFDWAAPDVVYHTYGKVFVLAFAGMLCGLLAVRRASEGDVRRSGGRFPWAPRLATAVYALALVGIIGEYWTPWSSVSFIALSIPSMLLLFVVSPFLGAWLLTRKVGSRIGGWMIALTMPGIIASTILGGHLGFAVIYLSAAWMLHARALMRDQAVPAQMPSLTRT